MNFAPLSIALRIALLACGLAWAITAIFHDRLPGSRDILPEMLIQPVQIPTTARQFNVIRGGITYAVIPKYEYRLYGLVVSSHDSRSWLDYAHESWNDYLNVKDLCVIWGSNTNDELYREFTFSSGQWTCNYETRSNEAWQAWHEFQLSNNHMLSDNEQVTDLLTDVEIGDQIYFRGYLAEYAHSGGFRRGTSTVRTDTGNGACETVYVTEFRILKRANPILRAIHDLGKYGFVLSLLGLATLFVKKTFFSAAPDPFKLLAQGQNLAMRGKYPQALAALTQALDLEPDLAEALDDRALVLDAMHQPDLAQADRRKARQLRGESANAASDDPPPLDL